MWLVANKLDSASVKKKKVGQYQSQNQQVGPDKLHVPEMSVPRVTDW